ncbi:uncharacterized protein LOC117320796 [Pecten maximus]|uniref:uncharacterized protein LOC117320796 n=1 Tax=Pecten maximus TaxID=6579 RepID=UPI00145820FA|nr:uncharacterized protein LOC117320796 [Pecten maximus]
MGCNNSKGDENIQESSNSFCWRKRNKVAPAKDPIEEKAGPSLDADNTVRKTKQTVLMQLKAEGIAPRKGDGGVAFIVEIGGAKSESSTCPVLPGVPESTHTQFAKYTQEACQSVNFHPPRRLPPINKSAMDAKQERARKNRERKVAERKSKWAKSYARVQATMQKSPN